MPTFIRQETTFEMNADLTVLPQLLEFATGIAREAGEITLKHFGQPVTTERKADNSFVTAADRETEAFLRERIMEKFPQDTVLGEEYGEQLGTSGRRWIVDPIDGTYSFVHGVPLFGSLIGLEIAGDTCLGVINMPALGEIVYAARGLGCFWNDKPAHVSKINALGEALLLATDFNECERRGFGAATAKLHSRVAARRTWGDCYGHLLVATGRAEVMLDPVMKIWDCAALLPIIEEAGGTFTNWRGKRTIYGGNAISTNGSLFQSVMNTITQTGVK